MPVSIHEVDYEEAKVAEANETALDRPTIPAIGDQENELMALILKNVEEINNAAYALAEARVVVDVALTPLRPLPGTTAPIPCVEVRFFASLYDHAQEKS